MLIDKSLGLNGQLCFQLWVSSAGLQAMHWDLLCFSLGLRLSGQQPAGACSSHSQSLEPESQVEPCKHISGF